MFGKIDLLTFNNEDNDYNKYLYTKLERGVFPKEMNFKMAVQKSLKQLVEKPLSEKSEIESKLDEYFIENLPPNFLAKASDQDRSTNDLNMHQVIVKSNRSVWSDNFGRSLNEIKDQG